MQLVGAELDWNLGSMILYATKLPVFFFLPWIEIVISLSCHLPKCHQYLSNERIRAQKSLLTPSSASPSMSTQSISLADFTIYVFLQEAERRVILVTNGSSPPACVLDHSTLSASVNSTLVLGLGFCWLWMHPLALDREWTSHGPIMTEIESLVRLGRWEPNQRIWFRLICR